MAALVLATLIIHCWGILAAAERTPGIQKILPTFSRASLKNGESVRLAVRVHSPVPPVAVKVFVIRDEGQDFSRGQERCLKLAVAEIPLVKARPAVAKAESCAVSDWAGSWQARGLSEGYYRVVVKAQTADGQCSYDWSLRFSDPIAGINTPGTPMPPESALKLLDDLSLPKEENLSVGVFDETTGYAYLGTRTTPGQIVKVYVGDGSQPPRRVASIYLNAGEDKPRCAVIDPAAGYAYFGTDTSPGKVVKVALGTGEQTPRRIGVLDLGATGAKPAAAVIDPAAGYAYFASYTVPGNIFKVVLGTGDTAPTLAGSVQLDSAQSEWSPTSAVIDPAAGYAYFGSGVSSSAGAPVIKIRLGAGSTPPTRVGSIRTGNGTDSQFCAAFIDPSKGYGYFVSNSSPSRLLKFSLGTGDALPTYLGATDLTTPYVQSAHVDLAGGYAYLCAPRLPSVVVKVALGDGTGLPTVAGKITLNSGEDYASVAALDAGHGYAYLATDITDAKLVQVGLGTGNNPPVRVGATEFIGNELLQTAIYDPSSQCAYYGSNTTPGKIIKVFMGDGSTPPRRVATLKLEPGEDYVYTAVADLQAGYAYFGTATSPGRVVKIRLTPGLAPPERVGALTLPSGENRLQCSIIEPGAGYAYFGTYTAPGKVVMVSLGAGAAPPSRVGALTLQTIEENLSSAVLDPTTRYAYFGAWHYATADQGHVIKIALGNGASLPTRVGTATLASYEAGLSAAVIDPAAGYALFGTGGLDAAKVVKVRLGNGSAAPSRVGAVTLNSGEQWLVGGVRDPETGLAYFTTSWMAPFSVVKVAFGSGSQAPQRMGALALSDGHYAAVFDEERKFIYTGGPSKLDRISVDTRHFLRASKLVMPESGDVNQVRFYSHAAGGNLRLGIYSDQTSPSLLWQSAPTSNMAANDWVTVPISAGSPSALTLEPGSYWLAWQMDTEAAVASRKTSNYGDGFYIPFKVGNFPARLNTGSGDERTTYSINLTNEVFSAYLSYGPPPANPTNAGVESAGADFIKYRWDDNSSDETGFKVWVDAGTGTPTTLRTTTAANATSWTQSGLAPNTPYTFQAAATSDSGDSTRTDALTTWTLIQPVGGMAFTSVTANSLSVAPTTSFNNLTSGSSGLYFGNTTAATDSGWRQSAAACVFNGLTPNTPYTFSGKSRNGTGIETAPFSAIKWTLTGAPSIGNNVNCNQTPGAALAVGTDFTFNNPAGFGPGAHGGGIHQVSAFRYAWDNAVTHVFSGSEPTWNTGTLTHTPSSGGSYWLHLQSLNGEGAAQPATLDYGPFIIAGAPVITAQPVSQTVNPGASVTFNVTASGTGALTYQWKKNGMAISGANGASYTLSAVVMADAGFYFCEVGSPGGNTPSNAARLVVNPTLTVASAHGTPTPARGSQVYTTGTLVNASVSGSPEVDTTGTTRWVSTGWVGSGSVAASGAGAATSFTIARDSSLTWSWKTQFYLNATASQAAGGSITLAGTSQAANATWHDAGTTVTLRATANSGYVFGGWSGDATGMTTTRSLGMLRPRAITATFIQMPAITAQPTSQTVDMGVNVSFSVTAVGGGTLAYQWYRGGSPLSNGAGISGATAATLQLTGVTESAEGNYTCQVSNSVGDVLSHLAVLQVLRPAQLSATPNPLTFLEGTRYAVDVARGEKMKERSLTLTNTGEKTLSFTGGGAGTPGLALTGRCAADYVIAGVSPATGNPLAAGASVTVTVRFAPTMTQRTLGLDAALVVTSNSPVSPTLSIPLLGDAVPVTLSRFSVE